MSPTSTSHIFIGVLGGEEPGLDPGLDIAGLQDLSKRGVSLQKL